MERVCECVLSEISPGDHRDREDCVFEEEMCDETDTAHLEVQR